MSRSAVIALSLLLALAGSLWAWSRWPSSEPALDCAPEAVTRGPDGVARCGPGEPLAAPQALVVGARLDLNRATAEALEAVPGVGPELARALVAERQRLGRFRAWSEVDAVAGVGPARLEVLQRTCEIGADGPDSGL